MARSDGGVCCFSVLTHSTVCCAASSPNLGEQSKCFAQDDNLRASRPRSDIPLAIMERGTKGVRSPKKTDGFSRKFEYNAAILLPR